jgi:hypothetical protein
VRELRDRYGRVTSALMKVNPACPPPQATGIPQAGERRASSLGSPIALSAAPRYGGDSMNDDRIRNQADQSESELESALHAVVRPSDATAALTHLVEAFDARRRRREARAIAETARVAAQAPRHPSAN